MAYGLTWNYLWVDQVQDQELELPTWELGEEEEVVVVDLRQMDQKKVAVAEEDLQVFHLEQEVAQVEQEE